MPGTKKALKELTASHASRMYLAEAKRGSVRARDN